MIPLHEVVEEGCGNAILNRGPRQGELECQGSQRVHIWTHPVCKDSSCSGAPRYDCGHISDLLVGHRVSLALMECALFLLIRSSASWAMSPRRLKKSWSASCAIRLNQPLQSSVGTSWRRGRRMSVLLLGDSSIRVRFCHEGPQDPSVLVGDGDAGSIGTAETRLLGDPATPGIGLRCGSRHDGTCSMDQQ